MVDTTLISRDGAQYANLTAAGAVKKVAAITGAQTLLTLPINAALTGVYVFNTTGNAVTGGIKVGTTAGGVDVFTGLAIGANVLVPVYGATLLKQWFSTVATQDLFIDAVVAWNSANLTVWVAYNQLP